MSRTKKIKEKVVLDPTALRALVDLRHTLQRQRIAFGNRLGAIERGADDASARTKELFERWEETFKIYEDVINQDIVAFSTGVEIVDRMVAVRGVGYLLAAQIVSMIDIKEADTVSSLWKYAGYGVDDNGNADRRKKGEKLCYNPRLKTVLYVLAGSMLKSSSPYRKEYDDAREYYGTVHPDWTPIHSHNAAIRRMVKLFLSHLWTTWRSIEGLPVTEPYAFSQLKHGHYKSPQEYGWEALT